MIAFNKTIYFLEMLKSQIELSDEAIAFIASRVSRQSYSKGTVFIKRGELCDQFYFLTHGLVRAYFNHDAKQITTWICDEYSLVTSVHGFFSQSPALETIQCLEPCNFECFSHMDLYDAVNKFPEINFAYRKTIEEYYKNSELRSYMARIPTAKDRYDFFVQNTKKELFDRIPKKYLASLLSIRPETLTRIS